MRVPCFPFQKDVFPLESPLMMVRSLQRGRRHIKSSSAMDTHWLISPCTYTELPHSELSLMKVRSLQEGRGHIISFSHAHTLNHLILSGLLVQRYFWPGCYKSHTLTHTESSHSAYAVLLLAWWLQVTYTHTHWIISFWAVCLCSVTFGLVVTSPIHSHTLNHLILSSLLMQRYFWPGCYKSHTLTYTKSSHSAYAVLLLAWWLQVTYTHTHTHWIISFWASPIHSHTCTLNHLILSSLLVQRCFWPGGYKSHTLTHMHTHTLNHLILSSLLVQCYLWPGGSKSHTLTHTLSLSASHAHTHTHIQISTDLVTARHHTMVSLPPSKIRCRAWPDWTLQMRMLSGPPVTITDSPTCQAMQMILPANTYTRMGRSVQSWILTSCQPHRITSGWITSSAQNSFTTY